MGSTEVATGLSEVFTVATHPRVYGWEAARGPEGGCPGVYYRISRSERAASTASSGSGKISRSITARSSTSPWR
jgi:hypothetical protein